MTTKIILADDHLIVRQALRSLLEREGFSVVGEASDGHEAVELARSLFPDVAVLDFAMPLLNGADAAGQIVKVSPWTKPILLTMHKDDRYVLRALREGAKGFVLKSQAADELVRAIREVCQGRTYLTPEISHSVIDALLSKRDVLNETLSVRERQVLQLVSEGKATKEIATILGISSKTAESHRMRLMRKLGIHEVATLVRYAIREGFVQP